MPEYIDRTKIEWKSFPNDFGEYSPDYAEKKDIDKMPIADVVEVVRCKECEYWHLQERCSYLGSYPDEPYMDADDFCSFGKRKEEGEKTSEEHIKTLKIWYKMGVANNFTLLYVFTFDNFENMIQEAKKIEFEHKGDMSECIFVFQAFKDDSFDFKTSCFSQHQLPVIGIGDKVEYLAKRIFTDYFNNKE